MKGLPMRFASFVLAFSLVTSAVNADILITDNFNYTGTLTENGWIAYSGADQSITSDGNVASIGSGTEDIRRVFGAQGSNPVFASFMLNVLSMPSTGGEYSFGFIDGSAMESRWGIVTQESGSGFGVTAYGSGSSVVGTVPGLSLNTSYLVTYYFDGVGDHRLWIDSDGANFDAPDLQTTAENTDIDGVFIRQAGALDNRESAWTMDNLIVSTTFAEVIPEPATIGILAFGALLVAIRRRRT